MRSPIPLRERRFDVLFMVFFFINLTFITYIVDLEQLVIADPHHFQYPLWPPARLVDLVHWWGDHYDPLQNARPMWWKATIWIDVLGFGPFYVAGLVAFFRGRDWIRLPGIIWASVMMTNVAIIMSEETWGPHASIRWTVVALANLPWFGLPIAVMARLWREHPFTREQPAG